MPSSANLPSPRGRRRVLTALAGLALTGLTLAGLPVPAQAQSAAGYPARPVRIVLPTPAGGPSDTVARLVAQALTAAWGQQVMVENRPGASGAIAAQAVMAAPPDGHVLLWAQASMAGLPLVQASTPYRSLKELAPVSNAVEFAYAVFVNKDQPFRTWAELVAHGRAHPGALSLATGTLGEFMVAEHVLKSAGVEAVRVPYKGGAQLMPDLISGQVQLNFGPMLSGLQHVRAGKLRMLATLAPQRSALLPDVPTATELGIPPGSLPTWNALLAPARTPPEVIDKIARAVAQALNKPELRAQLEQQGAHVLASTPAELALAVDQATQAWQAFVARHAIVPE